MFHAAKEMVDTVTNEDMLEMPSKVSIKLSILSSQPATLQKYMHSLTSPILKHAKARHDKAEQPSVEAKVLRQMSVAVQAGKSRQAAQCDRTFGCR